MIESDTRLRVVVAAPLSEELCHRIETGEPRLQLIRDQELLPPQRHPGDFNGDPSFHRTAAQQERFTALVDSADVLYGIPDVDSAALKKTVGVNPRLRWVQTMAAGGGGQVAAAELSAAQLERVAFTTSAGVHGGPLAEFALFGVLAGAKSLPRLLAQQHDHTWSGRWTMGLVSEQTVLVAGLGGIGAGVASRLAALGARVIGTTRGSQDIPGVSRFIQPEEIPSVAHELDAVVATLPGTAATNGLFGSEFFSRVKPGATVVNVGRGTVIDQDELLRALRNGRVGFAALDVFAEEPLATDSPFWDLPNVLVSPHTAALNAAEDRLIAELFTRNATRFLDGQPLINRVDTVEFY
ncbi:MULTISPECIES: D-2-hydroxyacid dehydrogenase [Cryobacterium]|uniref:D-2-hydroxyacid dehydrogenase n=1 Tax=Cryobacterium glucosi TaxID=1259175 RepID=A0ABY2IRM8_9MICO|nr:MULTISPECIES: D-2-hydroxyacid dehydrogenase [Cryobacterium]TFB95767.1 D-2-hydroxyacid dehydrogenase [Cryobacterium sp. MDB2-A-1]TFC04434.1 D-2-hydroxyacid dehydrogenase [Cryobacterium sp. MDB2-33-2]TFC12080.1 D-2-hydroxyacid dehydrogenase [Cryobacterium sp. MDB2-A-2]TFC15971.1 D-2-hydroxyacid dehydrogenase [Cryobacterium sp. MDB2-10]TFC23347.1 D-2-hydroxyacid dehydrogenase [Cryobacterium glucosi]